MILTLISPSGERWSATLTDFERIEVVRDFAATLTTLELKCAMAALEPLKEMPTPPKKSLLSQYKDWQAILNNP
jgi:hypothetical protein